MLDCCDIMEPRGKEGCRSLWFALPGEVYDGNACCGGWVCCCCCCCCQSTAISSARLMSPSCGGWERPGTVDKERRREHCEETRAWRRYAKRQVLDGCLRDFLPNLLRFSRLAIPCHPFLPWPPAFFLSFLFPSFDMAYRVRVEKVYI